MIKILGVVLRVEQIAAAIAYAIVAALLLGEVIAREAFFTSIWGSQKMAVFAAIVAGFLGLTLATAANGHLRPQFTDNWWPDRLQKPVSRFGDVLSAILYALLAYVSLLYVLESYNNHDRAAVLYWSLWPFQLIIPYAFASSALRHVAFAVWPESRPQPDISEG
jgi:TRAP-type C4-dicarboxylate transport system permease small subunit